MPEPDIIIAHLTASDIAMLERCARPIAPEDIVEFQYEDDDDA